MSAGGSRPGAGRPKRPAETKQAVMVRVYLTDAQDALLDALRGPESRSAYLARMGGLTTPPPPA